METAWLHTLHSKAEFDFYIIKTVTYCKENETIISNIMNDVLIIIIQDQFLSWLFPRRLHLRKYTNWTDSHCFT